MSADPLGRPKVLVLGAGERGRGYAEYIQTHPAEGQVVGVAEPNQVRRERFAAEHHVRADQVFDSWEAALAQPKFADLAMVTTQDAHHVAPSLAAAEAGYHILLEKPIAPTEAECRLVVEAAQQAGVMLTVCHVLRYTPHTIALLNLLNDNAIGELQSIEHLEPVGFWHFTHSFVRGNWRNESESSPILLAKSCHDLDWLLAIARRRCTSVSSFGSLGHFSAAHQPAGAADRCGDCPTEIERSCPYSAQRIYFTALDEGRTGWPLSVITDNPTRESVALALRDGPYGRCVYACDNDVVDHQVVNLEFDGGLTATFTMTAFTTMRGRQTRLFGSHGEISTDSQVITVDDFRDGRQFQVDTRVDPATGAAGGHGGGDDGLMAAVLAALASGDWSTVGSNAQQSLESHLMVFAAERARRQRTVESVPDH